MFLVPVAVMSVCYFMIVVKLYCTVSPGERLGGCSATQQSFSKKKKKVVKMVLVVILVFVVCCAPLQFLMAAAIFTTEKEVWELFIIKLDLDNFSLLSKQGAVFIPFRTHVSDNGC